MFSLLDFSSAFDTIDHFIPVHRLHTNLELTDAVLQWFSSYLTDRTHYILLSKYCSALTAVHAGVAQDYVHGKGYRQVDSCSNHCEDTFLTILMP